MSLRKAKLHFSKDKILNRVINACTILKLPNSGNVFNELVKAIVYQQISYKAADSIYARFVDLLGHEEYTPVHLIKQNHEALRSVGLSNQKAQYVVNIAHFFKENKLSNTKWNTLTDEEITNLLTQIKGVGRWTVQMILIFELHRPDVFPDNDLAIQYAVKELYDLKSEKRQLIREMNEIADAWSPFRSYASLYLWAWRRDNYK